MSGDLPLPVACHWIQPDVALPGLAASQLLLARSASFSSMSLRNFVLYNKHKDFQLLCAGVICAVAIHKKVASQFPLLRFLFFTDASHVTEEDSDDQMCVFKFKAAVSKDSASSEGRVYFNTHRRARKSSDQTCAGRIYLLTCN
jgi:hypothetical protein